MSLIDHANFDTTLMQSSNPSGSSPDGNVYFDSTGAPQLIYADELATITHPVSGVISNPLNKADGYTLRGLYNFINQEREDDETLRYFLRSLDGVYSKAGAFAFVNGKKISDVDRAAIRGSGWVEYAANDELDRVYHGVVSQVDIQPTTTSYYAFLETDTEASRQAATWTDFNRLGDINEAVQTYGSTANGDTTAGDFDYRETHTLVIRTRSWGYNPGETTSVLTKIAELEGFSTGYGVGESLNTNNSYDIAEVFGGSAVSPFTGMSLEKFTTPQTETGFNEADGNFTWVLHNTLGGTVKECAAYLDALALQDADVDAGTGTYYNGKSGRVWYSRNTAGLVVTSSIGGEGLFVEGLSVAEKQNIIQTDDAGAEKTSPYFPEVQITVGTAAVADTNAWYHLFYADGAAGADFDTSSAVTVNDSDGNPVKGNVATDNVAGKISFAYAYDTNTQAGLAAAIDKDMVVVVEGDGGAAQALTEFTVTRTAIIAVTCAPSTDNNA